MGLLAGVTVTAPSSAASPTSTAVVDQSLTSPWSAGANIGEGFRYLAQTFTAGRTGDLVGVSIDVYGDHPTTLHVEIRSVEAGNPTTTILSEMFLTSNTSELSDFVALPSPIAITTGEQYAIVVSYDGAPPPGAGQGQGLWRSASGDVYPGGFLFGSPMDGLAWERWSDFDAHFQTWVVPEPTPPSGVVVAWGANYFGETQVPTTLTGVVAISAGGFGHSLALTDNGTVVAWGRDAEGQIDVPSDLAQVTAIAAGGWHSLALKADGTVIAWGSNASGQTSVPSDLHDVTAIAAGYDHSLALKNDGTVVAWGNNSVGQLNVPPGLRDVTAIAAGANHSLALEADGSVVAWGSDQFGQIDVPPTLSDVKAVAGGWGLSLALRRDGTVAAWGWDAYEQRTVASGLADVVAIAAGYYHSLALKSDGTIIAFGGNDWGQTAMPDGVRGGVAISAGVYHSLALVRPAVPDLTPPEITTPADMHVSATSSAGAVVMFAATANDATDGPVPVTCEPPSGSTFPIGDTMVVCSASDAAGNTGHGSFKVSVLDTTPPEISGLQDMEVDATSSAGAVVTFGPFSATDWNPATPQVTCTPSSGSTFPIDTNGWNQVVCSATDAAGNTTTQNFAIHVRGAPEQITNVIALVQEYNLGKLGHSLIDKLVTVGRMLNTNKPGQAIENLNTFIRQVKSQRGKGLTTDQADRLITDALRIKAVIGP
jgi:hypothetical protein